MNKTSSILLSIVLVITGFGTLVLGNYLVFAIAVATNPDWSGLAPTGSLSFTGNVSDYENVNITYKSETYIFEFNTTNNGSAVICRTQDCIAVNLSGVIVAGAKAPIYYNQSYLASGNLTTAINSNASVAALVTATNESSVVRLSSTKIGVPIDPIRVAETMGNAAWSTSTLTGGKSPVHGQQATINYASIVIPLMGLLLMIFGILNLFAAIHNFRLNSGQGFTQSNNKETNERTSNGERSSSSGEGRG